MDELLSNTDKVVLPDNTKIVVNLNMAFVTLGEAKTVLSLAKQNPESATTLSACVAVIAAAALEQGTKAALSFIAEGDAIGEDFPASGTEAGTAMAQSFWRRVVQTPNYLSQGGFELNRKCRTAKEIQDLIILRNQLVHLDGGTQVLTLDSSKVTYEDGVVTMKIPRPKSPWETVNIKQAEVFLKAVQTYFEEILFIEDGQMKASDLLRSLSNR